HRESTASRRQQQALREKLSPVEGVFACKLRKFLIPELFGSVFFGLRIVILLSGHRHTVKMKNALEQLKTHTTISADTADYQIIKAFNVTYATTNPTIIFQTATLPQYQQLLKKAVQYGSKHGKTLMEKIENATDMVHVLFGKNLLAVIPGKVHIQIDTRLAFDTQASVQRALKLIQLFARENIPKDRVVIKLPSTWESIRAAEILELDHEVHCNMTTMFSLVQAAACAEASVYCVAPFVGRIRQWYTNNQKELSMDDHPGVVVWTEIFNYMRTFLFKTKVMGAYFLNSEEVGSGAGSEFLTIPVALLEELVNNEMPVAKKLSKVAALEIPMEAMQVTEAKFRWLMNEDEMATSLLSETIRKFAADCERLEAVVKDMLLA
ncbi:unnamed protein product, partial [Phaedon cochleariae]